MKTSTALLTVGLTLVAFAVILGVIWIMQSQLQVPDKSGPNITDDREELRTCEDLGCGSDAVYVGSVNSDKYYVCSCHYADRILPENVMCFVSDSEAVEAGYEFVEC